MELSNISDLITAELSSSFGVLLFIVIAAVYTIGQYFILHFSKTETKMTSARNRHLLWATKAITYGQYLLITFFAIIILQILILESYSSVILVLVVAISNGLGIFSMIVLAQRLLSYYKWEKDLIVLTYGASAIIAATTALVTMMFMGGALLNKPVIVNPESEITFPSFEANSVMSLLNYLYYILAIISFISIWFGTLLLMNQYSRLMGNRRRIFPVMALILGFYLSQVLIIYLSPYFIFNRDDLTSFLLYYRVIFTISSTIGGILFCIPFLQIARKFKRTDFCEGICNYLSVRSNFILRSRLCDCLSNTISTIWACHYIINWTIFISCAFRNLFPCHICFRGRKNSSLYRKNCKRIHVSS